MDVEPIPVKRRLPRSVMGELVVSELVCTECQDGRVKLKFKYV